MRRIPGVVMLATVLLVTGLAEPRPVMAVERNVLHAAPAAGPVTLLSYNVEGLPWPLTHGRGAAAASIAAELRAMHDRGDGPQVVAVQEAFGDAQKAIGTNAGYRYVAYGPSADEAGAPATTPAERAFVARASLWHGETEGAREDSGLAIFSDYPILWAQARRLSALRLRGLRLPRQQGDAGGGAARARPRRAAGGGRHASQRARRLGRRQRPQPVRLSAPGRCAARVHRRARRRSAPRWCSPATSTSATILRVRPIWRRRWSPATA